MMANTSNTQVVFDPTAPAVSKLLRRLNSPGLMRFFYWQKLPSLSFWGVKIRFCNPFRAEVSIPFRWQTQNPFRSTYFAALCGAAELSTGVLGMIAIENRGRISMLITNLEANFIKKATGQTVFVCEEGDKIQQAVQAAIETKTAQQIKVTSVGSNEAGETIAVVTLTWSFKLKS